MSQPRTGKKRAFPAAQKRGEIIAKNEWREALQPRIDAAKAKLAKLDPEDLAHRAGLTRERSGFKLVLLDQAYSIDWPKLVVRAPDGQRCPEELVILLLDYLEKADGSAPSGRWVGFQELPDGAFYRYAFQGYSGDQLVRDLAGDVSSFRRAAERLAADPLPMGDAGYVFRALPNVPLAVVWWAGDEEFPPTATVLFDEVAGGYLPTDGLAILGRMLCRRLSKLGGAE
jgi:hypothetical protein